MGHVREQSQSQVLSAHGGRPQTAQAGNSGLAGSVSDCGAVSGGKGIFMKALWRVWARVTGLFRKNRRDREMAQEFESHVQMHIDDNVRAGMSPEQARREALLKFGGMEATKELVRET